MIKKLFTTHPTSIGETYFQHLRHASSFSGRLLIAGFASLVHSIFPFLFEQTASRQIEKIIEKMNKTGRQKINNDNII